MLPAIPIYWNGERTQAAAAEMLWLLRETIEDAVTLPPALGTGERRPRILPRVRPSCLFRCVVAPSLTLFHLDALGELPGEDVRRPLHHLLQHLARGLDLIDDARHLPGEAADILVAVFLDKGG